MVTHISRHDFRTANATAAMAPIIKAGEEVLDDLETSEFDRFDALGYALAAAEWHCLTDPMATEFPTWEALTKIVHGGAAPWRRIVGIRAGTCACRSRCVSN
ncbi:hypothetical protein [Streptomyces sp. NBC_01727]|uniref:hypothetical protein n=1 Tax=unclassified Streptomyces TaxID=2593676 RepID=UPI002E1219A3|nr:hypothetical protein OIE76_22355 [Streptomyces sp. NBC_01727]